MCQTRSMARARLSAAFKRPPTVLVVEGFDASGAMQRALDSHQPGEEVVHFEGVLDEVGSVKDEDNSPSGSPASSPLSSPPSSPLLSAFDARPQLFDVNDFGVE
jgi:hypothetical protein